jgi:hypothetical protein
LSPTEDDAVAEEGESLNNDDTKDHLKEDANGGIKAEREGCSIDKTAAPYTQNSKEDEGEDIILRKCGGHHLQTHISQQSGEKIGTLGCEFQGTSLKTSDR